MQGKRGGTHVGRLFPVLPLRVRQRALIWAARLLLAMADRDIAARANNLRNDETIIWH